MGDTADNDLGCCCRHLAGWRNAVTEPFDEELSIGVEHDLDNGRVVESDAELVAERILELTHQTRVGAELGHGLCPA